MITRVPPGTWETLSFPSSQAAGDTAYQLPIDPRLRVRGRGDEPRTQRWYRQAKETKRGEMGGRESQHLIVPWKRGNHPEGPRGGKGVPSHEPLEGNMTGTPRPATVFTKQQRMARVANSWDEEPGARDVQARICGGPGWATTQVYPARCPGWEDYDLAGLSAFDEVLAMGSTWPFLGDPTVASGGRQRTAPDGFDHQGPDAPSAHRRPGYPLSGCVPQSPTPFHQATSE